MNDGPPVCNPIVIVFDYASFCEGSL